MRYASLRSMDISDGEGIGISLFVQGCHFHCKNCFNQDTWDFNGGEEFTDEIKEKMFQLLDKPYMVRISILGENLYLLQIDKKSGTYVKK